MHVEHGTPLFTFDDFAPPSQVTTDAYATLSWLMEGAPPDAQVSATMRRVGGQFVCRVDVRSALGFFRGEIIDANAQLAVDRAACKVKEAMKAWQRTRLGLDGWAFVELRHH